VVGHLDVILSHSEIPVPRCFVEPRPRVELGTYALRIGVLVSAGSRFLPSSRCFAKTDFRRVPQISPIPAEYLGQDLGWIRGLAGFLKPVLTQEAWRDRGRRRVVAVEDVGIEVDAARPTHGAGNRVDRCASKDCVVVEGGQNAGQRCREVEFAHEAVRERDSKHAAAEVLHDGDACEVGHDDRLLERFDRGQRSRLLRQCPVVRQVALVE
jgi:hypothetical protein